MANSKHERRTGLGIHSEPDYFAISLNIKSYFITGSAQAIAPEGLNFQQINTSFFDGMYSYDLVGVEIQSKLDGSVWSESVTRVPLKAFVGFILR
jgi:hypothetical protein